MTQRAKEMLELADKIAKQDFPSEHLYSEGVVDLIVPALRLAAQADAPGGDSILPQCAQEPVAWRWRFKGHDSWTYSAKHPNRSGHGWDAEVQPVYAAPQPPQQGVVVPDGYVLVPRKLTAENGAKGALIGEFHEDGGSVPVTWTTIKEIHKATVAHFDAALSEGKPGGDSEDPFNRKQVEAICRAVCKVEGVDPDDDSFGDGCDLNWTRYADAVAYALSRPVCATTENTGEK